MLVCTGPNVIILHMMVKAVLSSTPIHVVHVVGSFLIVARDLLSRMHGCMDECIPEGVLNYYGLRFLNVYGCMDVGCSELSWMYGEMDYGL